MTNFVDSTNQIDVAEKKRKNFLSKLEKITITECLVYYFHASSATEGEFDSRFMSGFGYKY